MRHHQEVRCLSNSSINARWPPHLRLALSKTLSVRFQSSVMLHTVSNPHLDECLLSRVPLSKDQRLHQTTCSFVSTNCFYACAFNVEDELS